MHLTDWKDFSQVHKDHAFMKAPYFRVHQLALNTIPVHVQISHYRIDPKHLYDNSRNYFKQIKSTC